MTKACIKLKQSLKVTDKETTPTLPYLFPFTTVHDEIYS